MKRVWGKLLSNKTEGDGHRKRKPGAKPVRKLPRSEWVIVENCHEAVKSQEEHDTIVKLLQERRQIGVRARQHVYTFSGLIQYGRCGHNHTFYMKQGREYIKSCWYQDACGNHCPNHGIPVDVIEPIVFGQIVEYKEDILKAGSYSKTSPNYLQAQKDTLELSLEKQMRAVNIINDAYEMGDYTREEWLKRKQKREKEMERLRNELDEMEQMVKREEQYTNEERTACILQFMEQIPELKNARDKNALYRTIINRIIYYKHGDTIKIQINFK